MTAPLSAARLNANRQNAQKSTGPRTEAGKSRSRANALKHGLTAEVVELETLDADQAIPFPAAAPVDARARLDKVWLTGQVTRTMTQITRAGLIEAKLRDETSLRAIDLWDDERSATTEELGARIAREPALVVARLRLTPHGCDWLLTRWGWLARAAATPEGWTEAQTTLAYNLLGVPIEGRGDSVLATVAADRDATTPVATLLELACERITDLHAVRDRVVEADEIARSLMEAGLVDVPTPALARLRRYEMALHKRLVWLMAELRGDSISPQAAASQPVTTQSTPPPPVSGRRETNPTSVAPGRGRVALDPLDALFPESNRASYVDLSASDPRFRPRA